MPGTVLAAPRSKWSVSIVGFISVYMEAINDDLTLGTNNIIWHINNKFTESKKPTSKQMRASQKLFIRLSSEDLGEVNLNHTLLLCFSGPIQTGQWMKTDTP